MQALWFLKADHRLPLAFSGSLTAFKPSAMVGGAEEDFEDAWS
jgi:hypothetical protein